MNKLITKSSIGMKLLKYVFFSYCLVAILLTVIHMLIEFSRTNDEIKNTLQLYQTLFEKTLSNEVWHLDLQQINTTLDGILNLPEVVGVSIYDTQGHYIARKGVVSIIEKQKTRMDVIPQTERPKFATDLFWHSFDLISNPGYGSPEKLGTVNFYSNTNIAISKVVGIFKAIIGFALIKTLILWVIFLFFGRRFLSVPLNALIDNMISFSETQTGKPFLELAKGDNEIDMIENTFVNISVKLSHTMDDIKKGYTKLRIIASIFEMSSTSTNIPSLLETILRELVKNPWLNTRNSSIHGVCISLFRNGKNQPLIKAHAGLPETAMARCSQTYMVVCV